MDTQVHNMFQVQDSFQRDPLWSLMHLCNDDMTNTDNYPVDVNDEDSFCMTVSSETVLKTHYKVAYLFINKVLRGTVRGINYTVPIKAVIFLDFFIFFFRNTLKP